MCHAVNDVPSVSIVAKGRARGVRALFDFVAQTRGDKVQRRGVLLLLPEAHLRALGGVETRGEDEPEVRLVRDERARDLADVHAARRRGRSHALEEKARLRVREGIRRRGGVVRLLFVRGAAANIAEPSRRGAMGLGGSERCGEDAFLEGEARDERGGVGAFPERRGEGGGGGRGGGRGGDGVGVGRGGVAATPIVSSRRARATTRPAARAASNHDGVRKGASASAATAARMDADSRASLVARSRAASPPRRRPG